MKRLREKLKAIRHIITDDEYAIYTVTIKNGKRVAGKTCCLISDNASSFFIDAIIKFTDKYSKTPVDERGVKHPNKKRIISTDRVVSYIKSIITVLFIALLFSNYTFDAKVLGAFAWFLVMCINALKSK